MGAFRSRHESRSRGSVYGRGGAVPEGAAGAGGEMEDSAKPPPANGRGRVSDGGALSLRTQPVRAGRSETRDGQSYRARSRLVREGEAVEYAGPRVPSARA